MRALAIMLLLGGCAPQALRSLLSSDTAVYGGSPIARATNGASATFSLTSCAPTTERARMVEETLVQLNQQGVLALADGDGTQVRVILNLCAQGPAPAPANQTRRP